MAREISLEELRAKLFDSGERFYLLDTLTHESYAHRHLPGAIGLPVEELEARAAELVPDRDALVVAYCSGPR